MKTLSMFFSYLASFILLISITTNNVYAVPAINSIQIRDIGFTSVTISWLTSEPSRSQISYGTNDTSEFTSPQSSVYASSHSITLSTLRPATQYQFVITATNEEGAAVTSQSRTFSTLSFDVDDSDNLGNFARLNDGLALTPTPTQTIVQQFSNPTRNTNLQQQLPSYTNTNTTQQTYTAQPQYAMPQYQQAPVYLVPPIIYQAPLLQQQPAQTLGETVVVTPTPFPAAANSQGSISYNTLLMLVLTFITGIIGLLSFQFMRNKKDLAALRDTMDSSYTERPQNRFNRKNTFTKKRQTERNKTYTFDVH